MKDFGFWFVVSVCVAGVVGSQLQTNSHEHELKLIGCKQEQTK